MSKKPFGQKKMYCADIEAHSRDEAAALIDQIAVVRRPSETMARLLDRVAALTGLARERVHAYRYRKIERPSSADMDRLRSAAELTRRHRDAIERLEREIVEEARACERSRRAFLATAHPAVAWMAPPMVEAPPARPPEGAPEGVGPRAAGGRR